MTTGMVWDNTRGRMLALRAIEKALRDMRAGDGFLYGNAGTAALWTSVLDEELRLSDVGPEYEVLRDREAPLIHGLIHARNGVSHAAAVTTRDGGVQMPFMIPATISEPAWLPVDDLHRRWTPERLHSPRVKKRIAMYEEHLAGKDPASTIQTVAAFFRQLEAAEWEPAEFGVGIE